MKTKTTHLLAPIAASALIALLGMSACSSDSDGGAGGKGGTATGGAKATGGSSGAGGAAGAGGTVATGGTIGRDAAPVDAPACGVSGQACCATNPRCSVAGQSCQAGICQAASDGGPRIDVACGGSGEACCNTNPRCTVTGQSCQNNVCRATPDAAPRLDAPCGGSGEACCTGGPGATRCTVSGQSCQNNICQATPDAPAIDTAPCGATGEACCTRNPRCTTAGDSCQGGTCRATPDGGGSVDSAPCGARGEACCPANPGPRCDSTADVCRGNRCQAGDRRQHRPVARRSFGNLDEEPLVRPDLGLFLCAEHGGSRRGPDRRAAPAKAQEWYKGAGRTRPSSSNLVKEKVRVVDYDLKARRESGSMPMASVDETDSQGSGGVPEAQLVEEISIPNPACEPGPILTLSAEEITRFFVRSRRDQDTERWDVRLDAALREILERANDFVPSEAGGILLDDPRATLAGVRTPRLTFIAVYGPDSGQLLGKRIPSDRGFVGQIYRSGSPYRSDHLDPDDPLVTLPGRTADPASESVIGVPVLVGDSICGVLELTNRRSGSPYSARDNELLRIFAAYMSSSIQNALDALRARAMARLDHLTGLFNSRYFHVRLQDEIAHADHNGTDLSLLFIDLDYFKLVNDRFGHVAGSWTLREVARLLSENAPPATVLARYGGDEFVAILPGADLQRALQTAELLRRVIEEASFFDSEAETAEGVHPLPGVRASIGVASYRDHLAPSGNQRRRENLLLRLADTAMYRAKANGRNRVEVAEAEE